MFFLYFYKALGPMCLFLRVCFYIFVFICLFLHYRGLGIETVVCDRDKMDFSKEDFNGVLLQYPDTDGTIYDPTSIIEQAHGSNVISNFTLLFHKKSSWLYRNLSFHTVITHKC